MGVEVRGMGIPSGHAHTCRLKVDWMLAPLLMSMHLLMSMSNRTPGCHGALAGVAPLPGWS